MGIARRLDQPIVLRYSPPGARITLRLSRNRSESIAEVIDQGPGIEAQHRTKVFDRFFRADAGRARTDGVTASALPSRKPRSSVRAVE
jgi:signal transduction histidine kinase